MSGAYNTPSLNAGSSNVKESHTRKIQKTSALDLLIDPRNFHYMRMPACMQLAIDYAKPILLSKRFREVLISLIPNCDSSKLDKALQESYDIKLLSRKLVIVTYCCVHREEHPNTIFINPLLLHNLIERELTGTAPIDDQVVFLTVKLVHEMSHLLHGKCSTAANILTPAKAYKDRVKYKTTTMREPAEKEEYVEYRDLGEMIEKELFGKLFEMKSADLTSYMDLQRVGVYSSLIALFGNYVDATATLANFTAGNYEIALLEEFKSNKTPCFTKMPLEGGNIRMSTPTIFGEEGEEGEEMAGSSSSSSFIDPTGNTRF